MRLAVGVLLGVATAFQPHGHEDLAFRPELKSSTVNKLNTKSGTFGALTNSTKTDKAEVARNALKTFSELNDWEVVDTVPTKHNGLSHIHFTQRIDGLDVVNSHSNVNVAADGRVLSMGATGVQRSAVTPSTTPVITPQEALQILAKSASLPTDKPSSMEKVTLEGKGKANGAHFIYQSVSHHVLRSDVSADPIPASLVWVAEADNKLTLAWDLVVRTPDGNHWYDAVITADGTNRLAMLTDWVNWESYAAYEIPGLDPRTEGPDSGRVIVHEPSRRLPESSPSGWNDQGHTQFTDTRGNNAYCQDNPTGGSGWENNYRPDGSAGLEFNFPLDLTIEPAEYKDAAIANLNYWNNLIHDVFWARGFDEESGNFQENNWGRGGLQVDAVQANAQDGAGYNNANFATPPDGQRPRMRMYLWNQVSPMIDGDLDSGIVVHEYGHGISTRLTGGPSRSGCLSGGQSGGMGEGWGDFWAIMFEQREDTTEADRFPMGMYAAGRSIRPLDYSSDMDVNPSTYETLTTSGYTGVHAIGSVWCNMLFDVYWHFRNAAGFDPDWYNGQRGNNYLWQNVVDGLKIQQCQPNFLHARDAIIQADEANYQGENLCILWCGFAKRGLGMDAVFRSANSVDNGFAVPAECSCTSPQTRYRL